MGRPFRILVTGSREWADRDAVYRALFEVCRDVANDDPTREIVVVHGAARGADHIADEWARTMRGLGRPVDVERYRILPADWQRHGKAAGHRRNAEMVAAGADVCIAFPLGESRGTRGCMALAERAGIPVVSHEYDHA